MPLRWTALKAHTCTAEIVHARDMSLLVKTVSPPLSTATRPLKATFSPKAAWFCSPANSSLKGRNHSGTTRNTSIHPRSPQVAAPGSHLSSSRPLHAPSNSARGHERMKWGLPVSFPRKTPSPGAVCSHPDRLTGRASRSPGPRKTPFCETGVRGVEPHTKPNLSTACLLQHGKFKHSSPPKPRTTEGQRAHSSAGPHPPEVEKTLARHPPLRPRTLTTGRRRHKHLGVWGKGGGPAPPPRPLPGFRRPAAWQQGSGRPEPRLR